MRWVLGLLLLLVVLNVGMSSPTFFIGHHHRRLLLPPRLSKERLERAKTFLEVVASLGKAVLVFPMLFGVGPGTFLNILLGPAAVQG